MIKNAKLPLPGITDNDIPDEIVNITEIFVQSSKNLIHLLNEDIQHTEYTISKIVNDRNINLDRYLVFGKLSPYKFTVTPSISRFFLRNPIHHHYEHLWPHLKNGDISTKKLKQFGALMGHPIRRKEIHMDPDAEGNIIRFPSFRAIWLLLDNFCVSHNALVTSNPTFDSTTDHIRFIARSIEHMATFLTIHPFMDGNGRVSRCILQAGITQLTRFHYPVLPIGVLSYLNAPLYYASMEQICVYGNWRPFLSFMFCMLAGSAELLREILELRAAMAPAG